jgi:hypothetical protein
MLKNVTFLDHLRMRLNEPRSWFEEMLLLRGYSENWVDCILFARGITKKLEMRLRNGESLFFTSRKEYNDFWYDKRAIFELNQGKMGDNLEIDESSIVFEYRKKKSSSIMIRARNWPTPFTL